MGLVRNTKPFGFASTVAHPEGYINIFRCVAEVPYINGWDEQ
jgi:hypothetical protein